MSGPLHNLRIIELGHVIAGPLSAALLSDFGADVIKVEAPNRTDMMRDLGPKAKDGVGVWWKTLGRNKQTLGLDWKSDEGRGILRKLVEGADVLVENFRPGVLERAAIGPEILHGWNPDLVILRVSGYGQDGPMRDVPAFGRAAEAMSGLAHLTGFTDGPPMHPGSLRCAPRGVSFNTPWSRALRPGRRRPVMLAKKVDTSKRPTRFWRRRCFH